MSAILEYPDSVQIPLSLPTDEPVDLISENDPFDDLVWSPDGQDIYVTNSQGVWRFDANDLNSAPRLFDMYLTPLALHPDNLIAASVNVDGGIVFWNRHSGALIDTFYAPVQSLRWFNSLAFSLDGTQLAMGISGTTNVRPDGALSVWDVAERQEIVFIREVVSPVEVAFDPSGDYVVTGGYIGLTLHEIETWNRLPNIDGSSVNSPSISFNGRWLAYWDWRNSAPIVIDLQTGGWLNCDLRTEEPSVTFSSGDVAFSPQSPDVIAISQYGYLSLWDLASCELIYAVPSPVYRLAYHPQGTYIAGVDGQDIHIYDAETLEELN